MTPKALLNNTKTVTLHHQNRYFVTQGEEEGDVSLEAGVDQMKLIFDVIGRHHYDTTVPQPTVAPL
jgi:hypothetical protein